jgi:cytochrome c oxidase subunit 2
MTGTPESIFSPDSPQAGAIAHLFIVTLIICALIFAIVAGLVSYCLWRFRGQPGDGEPEQGAGNKTVEILWTLIPFAIVVFLFALTLHAMAVSNPPLQGPPDLVVIGHQWWWEIRDPRTGVVTANEMHIPVGRPISLELDTADVLHEFWVPRLTPKMTTVPLQGNHLWIEADHPGTFDGVCSEFCGTQHAWMRFQVVAQRPADYAAWVHHEEAAAPRPTGEADEGWRQFHSMTCVNCHTVRGTDAAGRAGPDLTHFATRHYLGAGVAANTPANLRAWLADPGAVKPGAKMPSFRLTGPQLDAMVAYIETLR